MIIICDLCSKGFYRRPSRVRKTNNYCSKECFDQANGSCEVECNGCGKTIRRGKKLLEKNKTKKIFCSMKCKINYTKKANLVKCSFCSKDLIRQPYHKNNKTGLYFCGFKCRSYYYKKAYKIKCYVCGKDMERVPADQKRYGVSCCSIECRSKYNNKTKRLYCPNCGKIFYRPPSLIDGKKDVFCSIKCHNEFQDNKIQVSCIKCGKKIMKSPIYIKRNRHHFCSPGCFSKYHFEESYVEKQFEELVLSLGIKYIRNDRDFIKPLELDFFFPDISFAVEINGATHYKPIYGEDQLAGQKARDKRKKNMCKQKGVILRIVKPGNCKISTYLPRYKRVIWEIKRRMKELKNE